MPVGFRRVQEPGCRACLLGALGLVHDHVGALEKLIELLAIALGEDTAQAIASGVRVELGLVGGGGSLLQALDGEGHGCQVGAACDDKLVSTQTADDIGLAEGLLDEKGDLTEEPRTDFVAEGVVGALKLQHGKNRDHA